MYVLYVLSRYAYCAYMYVCMYDESGACDSFDGGYLELAGMVSEEGLEGHGLEVVVLLR